MKFLFLPFSIVGGLIAGLVGKKLFEQLWGLIDEEEPPDAKHRETSWAKLAAALVLEGAIFRLVRGLFDHGARERVRTADGHLAGRDAAGARVAGGQRYSRAPVIDHRVIHALHVESLGRGDMGADIDDHHAVFQTSTLQAVLDGAYDGEVTFAQLAERGDFGLGRSTAWTAR